VKSLGKVFNCSLKDTNSIKATRADLEGWLRAVDKSGHLGRFKVWVYQHGILPRILWSLLIYEVPMMVVEGFERKVGSYLRRWLGLPCSLSSMGLYGNGNKLMLPFSSVRVRVHRGTDTGRAAEAVPQAEARLKHKALLGCMGQGRTLELSFEQEKRSRRRCVIQWRKIEQAGRWQCDSRVPG